MIALEMILFVGARVLILELGVFVCPGSATNFWVCQDMLVGRRESGENPLGCSWEART